MTCDYTNVTALKGTIGALERYIALSELKTAVEDPFSAPIKGFGAKILLSMPQLLVRPVGIYARHGERNGSYPWDVVS
jgi:hypothetical protein